MNSTSDDTPEMAPAAGRAHAPLRVPGALVPGGDFSLPPAHSFYQRGRGLRGNLPLENGDLDELGLAPYEKFRYMRGIDLIVAHRLTLQLACYCASLNADYAFLLSHDSLV